MKRIEIMMLILLLPLVVNAGERLKLKDITGGVFRGESMGAVQALADGETYAQETHVVLFGILLRQVKR